MTIRFRTNFQLQTCVRLAMGALVMGLTAVSLRAGDIVVDKNITYGKGGDRDLQLDLARPKESNGLLPAIVYIHGGGWHGGNRTMYGKEIEIAAQRGYVAVTISYRLTKPEATGEAKNLFPAQIEDAKCAVRWLRANAEKYHIDPNRIGATGGSAGGHLSLMLGVTGSEKELEGKGGNSGVSSRVQAVVNYFGPTDMAHLFATSKGAASPVQMLLGAPPNDESAQRYRAASPVTYVSKESAPTLTIHGTADPIVPVDQATEFDAAMKKAGATHELLLLEGEKHGFRQPADDKAREATFKFFDAHLKAGA